jgi:hypothetical protein
VAKTAQQFGHAMQIFPCSSPWNNQFLKKWMMVMIQISHYCIAWPNCRASLANGLHGNHPKHFSILFPLHSSFTPTITLFEPYITYKNTIYIFLRFFSCIYDGLLYTITPHRQNFNLSPTAYNAYISCSILETIDWNIKFCQKLKRELKDF